MAISVLPELVYLWRLAKFVSTVEGRNSFCIARACFSVEVRQSFCIARAFVICGDFDLGRSFLCLAVCLSLPWIDRCEAAAVPEATGAHQCLLDLCRRDLPCHVSSFHHTTNSAPISSVSAPPYAYTGFVSSQSVVLFCLFVSEEYVFFVFLLICFFSRCSFLSSSPWFSEEKCWRTG